MAFDLSAFPEGREVQTAQQIARQRRMVANLAQLRLSTLTFRVVDGIALVQVGRETIRYSLRESRWTYRGRDHLGNAEAFLQWVWNRGPKSCRVAH